MGQMAHWLMHDVNTFEGKLLTIQLVCLGVLNRVILDTYYDNKLLTKPNNAIHVHVKFNNFYIFFLTLQNVFC